MWLDGVSVGRRASVIFCAAGAAAVSAVASVRAWRRIKQLLNEDNHSEDGYTWTEIVTHKSLRSAWIVIHGEVYDVTPFLQEHPGGKILLLAYAGSDATEPFTAIGHSAMATRALKRLHIGAVRQRSDSYVVEAKSERPAKITGGYLTPHTTKAEAPLWEVKDYGFLPSRDPVPVEALYGTAFEPYARLAELMPNMCVSGSFRKYINTNTVLHEELRKCTAEEVDKLSEDLLERAFSVVGYICNAYWRGGLHKYGNGLFQNIELPISLEGTAIPPIDKIPEYLGTPFLHISAKLNRPPRVDYAATVLYNWERIDPDGPIVVSNIRCPLRLSGLSDEEWFFKTHVVIESEAAPAVSAVIQLTATDDDQSLLQGLIALEEALWRTVRACMPVMYDRAEHGMEHGTSKCNEHIFYQVLRPLISTGAILFEGEEKPRFLHGPSGAMSSLMPAVDAALGIQMTSVKLREALDMFEKSMPEGHKEFLKKLRNCDSIRTRILLARPVGGQSDEHHESLVRSYNRCISRILDFRWQHWQYVKNFIMKPGDLSFATGTGGTSFDYLQQHITDTEQARIAEHGVGFTTIGTPYAADGPILHLPSLPGVAHSSNDRLSSYEVGSYWSVDGPYGLLSAEPMLGLEDWEVWQKTMPAHLHGAVYELLQLAIRLPALCASDNRLYSRVEEVKDKLAPLRDDSNIVSLSETNRERLLTLLSFVSAGLRATTTGMKVPTCIDRPLQVGCRLAGRAPQIDIVALLQANWTADGLDASEGGSGTTTSNGRSHLRVVCNFAPSPDEAWYRAVHLVLFVEARDVVAAVRAGQTAALTQDDKGVIQSLQTMDAWMNKLCDYFDAHFDQKDSRTEGVSFRRTAKFVAQNLFDEEGTAVWVYTMGGSVLLPMLHAILGLAFNHFTNKVASPEVESLREHFQTWSEEMKMFMPIPHRNFLDNLQKPGVSLRQYCIKRFGNIKTSVEELHALEVAYNDALNGLVRFLSRRMHLVVRFQPDLSSAFATFHAHLEASIRKQRLQLLKMRQRVLARLES